MLAGAVDGIVAAGRVRHPEPHQPPGGFEACEQAADLYYRWESAWGGSVLLGTEGFAVIVFNAGYPLEEVALAIRGEDEGGKELFRVEHGVEALPHGQEVRVEVPSYELPEATATKLKVALVSAEFAPEE